jgi:hypothetical protein
MHDANGESLPVTTSALDDATHDERRGERRQSRRRPLRSRALLVVQGSLRQVHGRTAELSLGGLSLLVPTAVAIDSTCALGFAAQVNGELRKVSVVGRVRNCVCVADAEFRIGLEFTGLDAMSTQTIATLVASEA